jgi:hypothetical protein
MTFSAPPLLPYALTSTDDDLLRLLRLSLFSTIVVAAPRRALRAVVPFVND